MLELNDLERDDLRRLGESYTKVMGEFNNDEARSLHAPHGVFAFVHDFFHSVFADVLASHAEEATAALAEQMDNEEHEADEDGAVVINMEPLIMKAFEVMVMVGIEVGKARLGPEKCRCIENVITERMLTLQLRKFEENKIIKRTVHAEVPPRVEYELTPIGYQLKPIIKELEKWGKQHQEL